ncbi:MAG: MucBP domain-containing protein [Propionibacteriaceae bacterium]|nr:MucBP domain-containing protein [Propionibacteriaceae bacterium]
MSIASLSLSMPDASAASYDISTVGTAAIVSVSDMSDVLYDSSNPAPRSPGSFVTKTRIEGVITDPDALVPGSQITIPITVTAHSYAAVGSLNGNAAVFDSNSVNQFVASYVENLTGTSYIILTKTDEPSGGADVAFVIDALVGGQAFHASEANSEWVVDGNVYVFPHGAPDSAYLPTGIPVAFYTQPNGNQVNLWTWLGNEYAQLLNGTLDITDPVWSQNFVQVATITADDPGTIVNVEFAGMAECAYLLLSDGTGLDAGACGWVWPDNFTNFLTDASLEADMTFAQIEAALPVGSRALVKNSDGTYTVAMNWGPLSGNPYLTYPAGTTATGAQLLPPASPDTAADNLVAAAIALQMAPAGWTQAVNVEFDDPTLLQGETVTVWSNISLFWWEGKDEVSHGTDAPVFNAAEGQTLVRVHYVENLTGDPLDVIDWAYGWPVGGSVVLDPSSPYAIAPREFEGYHLVEDIDLVVLPPAVLGAGTVLIGDPAEPTELAFPLEGGAPLDVYYVYNATLVPVEVKHLLDLDDDGVGDESVDNGNYDYTTQGAVGTTYSTYPISAADLQTLGYMLVSTPANASGTFAETNADVVYVYAREPRPNPTVTPTPMPTPTVTPTVTPAVTPTPTPSETSVVPASDKGLPNTGGSLPSGTAPLNLLVHGHGLVPCVLRSRRII